MNVIYLFMSQGPAPTNSISDSWKPPRKCGSQYEDFKGEGTFKLLGKLHNDGIINDLRIFYESNRDPGIACWIDGVYCCVVPEIRFIEKFIKKDTIFFVRGGFRTWHDYLVKFKDKHWLMLYAANTGRQRWRWWDIILQDLEKINHIDRFGRYWNYYVKPTDEEIFHPKQLKLKYDLCIGASHIHDKKGQWRAIDILVRYKRKYGKNLKCIMPGASRRGVKSNKIHEIITQHALDVDLVGKVTRERLCDIFNQSRYFIHLGTHGQNDRGPIEALSCGTPLIIGSPTYHAPVIYENPKVTYVPKDINNFNQIACVLNNLINNYDPNNKNLVYDYYRNEYSFNVSYDRLKSLLELMSQNRPNLISKNNIKSYFNALK